MKKSIILAGLLLATSCATTPEVTTATVRRVATLAELASYTGVSIDLKAKPEHILFYQVAQEALDAMLLNEDYDPIKFADIIKQLPVKEIGSYEGALVVTSAIVVWQEYSNEVLKLDKGVYIKPIMVAVNNGLKKAIEQR